MTLWLIVAGITAAVLALLLLPLRRRQIAFPPQADYDIAVYRDQLAEVEKDITRNLLTTDQAKAARAEIQRRMLAAGGSGSADQKNGGSFRSTITLALIILIGLPLGAGLMYGWLGHPELPGKPYADRQHDPDFILTIDAEQLAAELEQNPDADEYKRLAGIWFVMRRYDKAAEADQKIIDLNGGDAKTWSSLGEATAFSHEGEVTPEARAAFVKALQFDPHNFQAQFYLGLYEEQTGQPQRALAIWRDLEKTSPQDAPWLPMLKKKIAGVSNKDKTRK